MDSSVVDHLDEQSFAQAVLAASGPVLVDFYADWCQPCHVMAPIIDAIAQEFDGRARIGRVNLDQSHDLARQYEVNAIPTILIFNNGQVVRRIVGVSPQEDLAHALSSAMA